MTQERVPYDTAYKNIFSNPEMVESLLRDFVPESLSGELDFTTLQRCSGTYVTDDLRERHDDIIWRVRWKIDWVYIYILLEFQSTHDPWMAVRILAYTALLWQDLIKTGEVRSGDRLPPVFPLVLYNGGSRWTAAQDVAELLSPIKGPLSAYQPRQKYFLLEESQIPERNLTENESIAALLIRLERASELEDALPIVDAVMTRLHAPQYDSLRRAFAVWTSRVLFKRAGIMEHSEELSDLQEVRTMLAERAMQWKDEYIQKGVIMGREEGISIGESRGIELALRDTLETRFGELSQDVLCAITEVPNAQRLRSLMRCAVQVASLEDFLNEMRKC